MNKLVAECAGLSARPGHSIYNTSLVGRSKRSEEPVYLQGGGCLPMLSVISRCWKFLLVCLLVCGFSATATYADGTVTGIKVVNGSNALRVEISANGTVHHRTKTLSSPQKQIIVDVFPATLGQGVKANYAINKGLVNGVHVKQLTDNTVRVSIDVIAQPEYKVVDAPGSKGLTLAISDVMTTGKASSTPVKTAVAPVMVPEKRVAVAPVHKMTKKVAPKVAARTQRKVATEAPVTLSNRHDKALHQSMSGRGETMSALTGRGETTSALRARVAPRRYRPRQRLVNLDFVNADLVFVIKVLAREMGRNIYIAPGVDGSVTVTLKSVPVEGALALILKMQENEYQYKMVGSNTLVVGPPEKLNTIPTDILGSPAAMGADKRHAPRGSIRQEVLLEKAPAAKVIGFLEGQYKNVVFTPHPTMNGFYVLGSRADVLQIKSEVPNLDRVPEPPTPPQREFVPIKYGDLNEIKSLLATLVPDVQYNVDSRRQVLILEGAPGAIDQVKELLAELDRPVDQVMIDCKVVDLSENGSKSIGMTWGQAGAVGTLGTTFAEGAVGQSPVRSVNYVNGASNVSLDPAIVPSIPTYTSLAINSFARTPFVIASSIQFLVTQGEAKVLAAPRIATLSDKESLIHIGDKFPIVYFDPRAGQFQVQYVDIGIKLDVKPSVKADGYILCDIRPEVSTLVELVNNQYPRTAVRTVQSNMRVKDGDTVVIGGLINEQDIQNVQKVPLLGDLPIIGALFRNVSVTRSRNEVVLMLTPHVMK
jgi:type II secretory pathway component GspD/PulD (secretin)